MHRASLEGSYSVGPLPRLRVAMEGCYPTFSESDLVIRIIRILSSCEIVHRWEPHDLLIRGPFAQGSIKRRLATKLIRLSEIAIPKSKFNLSLHVSSENTFLNNYQSYHESNCDFGIGHELRVGDSTYLRVPHWWNYVDFSTDGIPSPPSWVRLGGPLLQSELTRPRQISEGRQDCAFISSYLNSERTFLLDQVSSILTVNGYGKAFNPLIKNHSSSSFTKRQILKSYRYNLCPENSISPGYVTEKIPEAFASGCIPIGYVDPTVAVDFNPLSFVNLHSYLADGIPKSLSQSLHDPSFIRQLDESPLLLNPIPIHTLIEFLSNILDMLR